MPSPPVAKKAKKPPTKTTRSSGPPARAAKTLHSTRAAETGASFGSARAFRVLRDEIVRADKRGRLTVGDAVSAKQFRILINDDGQILLDPVVVMSEREVWLYKNPHALASVMQGLREAAAGEVHDLGTFAKDA